jgi:CRISPR-associated exonuclease Cas4
MQTINEISFEVTDLKQWTYCPRIVYYRYCMPDIRPITDHMRQGIAKHQDESAREERRSLRTYGLQQGERSFDLALRSSTLGIRGRLDLVIATPDRSAANAEAIVVEYKDSEQVNQPHFALQLAAYALLVEEAWGLAVKRGFLYSVPLRHAETVPITAALRRKALATIAALREAVIGEHMPPAPASRRPCVGCEFRRFCGDVV